MNQNLLNRIQKQQLRYKNLVSAREHTASVLLEAHKQMDSILKEQDLLERTTVAIQQARPLLSASSIKQCEELANTAMRTIFNSDAVVEWDVESSSFVLNHGDYKTSIADSEGGGIATVLSTIFSIYLLVKMGKRRLMVFDESFYAISSKYITEFLQFLRQMCHDLDVDLICVSHDVRITLDDVDTAYLIEDGKSRRLK